MLRNIDTNKFPTILIDGTLLNINSNFKKGLSKLNTKIIQNHIYLSEQYFENIIFQKRNFRYKKKF